jgi:2-phospho-L-lactate transferase/gluconeogenesis factor (CofD/UPF0052 family)/uncharacterized protein with ATP-grasp and redox domains
MDSQHKDVEVLNEDGAPSGKKKPLDTCHHQGLWHLGFVLIPLTEWGEAVLYEGIQTKNGNSGGWSIIEGHVPEGATSEESALGEITRKLTLHPDPRRLVPLLKKYAVTEELVLEGVNIANNEYRCVYAYTLSWEEYQTVREADRSGGAVPAAGNSARLRFLGINELLEETGTSPAQFSLSTLNNLRNPVLNQAVVQFWTQLINRQRQSVVESVLKITGKERAQSIDDTIIMDTVLHQPEEPAAEFDVRGVFLNGKATCPGAYFIGDMLKLAGHIPTWKEKLAYPYQRYVEEELEVLRSNFKDPAITGLFDSLEVEDACRFIREILHFPLEDGTLLRSGLGNLEERSVSRTALWLFLHANAPILAELMDHLYHIINQNSNRLVRDVWLSKYRDVDFQDNESLRRLFRLNILLNTFDFRKLPPRSGNGTEKSQDSIVRLFEEATAATFSIQLGGDHFIGEFLERWLSTPLAEPGQLIYLSDNNGQLVVSLKCIEAILKRQPGLSVILIPKNGQYGNDASWKDVEHLLDIDAKSPEPIFTQLSSFQQSGRFELFRDGPRTTGLHPGAMSKKLCSQLRSAAVVIAEGQAYAEICGWICPTYLVFRVTGRTAESIHGVDRGQEALGFIRVGSGAVHFSQTESLPRPLVADSRQSTGPFNLFSQTTSDYIKAVLSENYQLLCQRIFHGKEYLLHKQLRDEGRRMKKNIVRIVLGTPVPGIEEIKRSRKAFPPDIFAIGGGGGFNQVTLRSLQMLDLRVTAGVPSTDDGGSTGKIQQMIAGTFGYMFGVGDAAAILEQQVACEAKQPILSFRPPQDTDSLLKVFIQQAIREIKQPTIETQYLTDCPDFLSFLCEQMNFARVIDEQFLGENGIPGFTIKGASIRNLNILAAFFQCGAIVKRDEEREDGHIKGTDSENAGRAWFLIESALGLEPQMGRAISTLPVTYHSAVLWATYNKAVPESEIKRLRIPQRNLSDEKKTVYGQQYIDQIVMNGKITDFGIVNSVDNPDGPMPAPDPAYLESLRNAKLFIMGAGSLYGSQLAQLAVPGVMAELIRRKDIRKVLVVNHVCMNETNFYSLTDHIKAIEGLAEKVVDESIRHSLGGTIRIGHIFSDIIVPSTVAREIEIALEKENTNTSREGNIPAGTYAGIEPGEPVFVTLNGERCGKEDGIYLNRYVQYVLKNPDFRAKQQITDWELRVLSFLEQPSSLYKSRSEAGRYRGAVYARDNDIAYLVDGGIPPRHIYEVESIAMNMKILKAAGKPQLEEFPGLIPESLVGVFKILLAKGALTSA